MVIMLPWIWSKIFGADYSLGERREVEVVMFLDIQQHLPLILGSLFKSMWYGICEAKSLFQENTTQVFIK